MFWYTKKLSTVDNFLDASFVIKEFIKLHIFDSIVCKKEHLPLKNVILSIKKTLKAYFFAISLCAISPKRNTLIQDNTYTNLIAIKTPSKNQTYTLFPKAVYNFYAKQNKHFAQLFSAEIFLHICKKLNLQIHIWAKIANKNKLQTQENLKPATFINPQKIFFAN